MQEFGPNHSVKRKTKTDVSAKKPRQAFAQTEPPTFTDLPMNIQDDIFSLANVEFEAITKQHRNNQLNNLRGNQNDTARDKLSKFIAFDLTRPLLHNPLTLIESDFNAFLDSQNLSPVLRLRSIASYLKHHPEYQVSEHDYHLFALCYQSRAFFGELSSTYARLAQDSQVNSELNSLIDDLKSTIDPYGRSDNITTKDLTLIRNLSGILPFEQYTNLIWWCSLPYKRIVDDYSALFDGVDNYLEAEGDNITNQVESFLKNVSEYKYQNSDDNPLARKAHRNACLQAITKLASITDSETCETLEFCLEKLCQIWPILHSSINAHKRVEGMNPNYLLNDRALLIKAYVEVLRKVGPDDFLNTASKVLQSLKELEHDATKYDHSFIAPLLQAVFVLAKEANGSIDYNQVIIWIESKLTNSNIEQVIQDARFDKFMFMDDFIWHTRFADLILSKAIEVQQSDSGKESAIGQSILQKALQFEHLKVAKALTSNKSLKGNRLVELLEGINAQNISIASTQLTSLASYCMQNLNRWLHHDKIHQSNQAFSVIYVFGVTVRMVVQQVGPEEAQKLLSIIESFTETLTFVEEKLQLHFEERLHFHQSESDHDSFYIKDALLPFLSKDVIDKMIEAMLVQLTTVGGFNPDNLKRLLPYMGEIQIDKLLEHINRTFQVRGYVAALPLLNLLLEHHASDAVWSKVQDSIYAFINLEAMQVPYNHHGTSFLLRFLISGFRSDNEAVLAEMSRIVFDFAAYSPNGFGSIIHPLCESYASFSQAGKRRLIACLTGLIKDAPFEMATHITWAVNDHIIPKLSKETLPQAIELYQSFIQSNDERVKSQAIYVLIHTLNNRASVGNEKLTQLFVDNFNELFKVTQTSESTRASELFIQACSYHLAVPEIRQALCKLNVEHAAILEPIKPCAASEPEPMAWSPSPRP